ncbi:MAG: SgcJ/EcaC family oxidoreductase [Planctomycetes bacterium]|nr:SgcJ/EcaC family oxidoreductase [Planctomycetota bacterium]
MKHLPPIAFSLLVASNSLAQTPALDSLENFVSRYEESWQFHDAERLADFFAEDADMIIGIQPMISGRAAIQDAWDRYFSRLDRGRTISISVKSIRILSPDVALLNVETTTGGTHSQTHEVMELRRARGTWVMTRTRRGWTISALRAQPPVGELREVPGTDK